MTQIRGRRLALVKGAHSLFLSCAATFSMACQQRLNLGSNDVGLRLNEQAIVVPQDGQHVTLRVILTGDAAGGQVQPVFDSLPPGVGWKFAHDAGNASGSIEFWVAASAAGPSPIASPGDYPVRITAFNSGTQISSAPQDLLLTVAVVANVAATVSGPFREFVSTSLQPAPFQQYIPDPAALAALTQEPIHVQVYDPPWKGTSEQDLHWNFDELNGVLKPLLERDASVQLEIYTGPQIGADPRSAAFDMLRVDLFQTYCLGLLSYYNRIDGGPGQSPFPGKVGWWSILGDCNAASRYCALKSTSDYDRVYNQVAGAMRGADSTIKLSAFEATDTVVPLGYAPKNYLDGVFAPPDAGGVDPRLVDSIAVHMFAARESVPPSDDVLLGAVPVFADHIGSIVSQLRDAGTPDVDVWVTQSNVSSNSPADDALPDGAPQSSLGGPLILDTRGTSTFFVAWQAYMFSKLGQAGGNALFHWDYTAGHDPDGGFSLDRQNAEVSYDDGGIKYPGYWVDFWLGRMFPSTLGHQVLKLTTTEATKTVDVLATRDDYGSVVVMVTNIAPDHKDPNVLGRGLSRTVVVDVSALGDADAGFSVDLSSASVLKVDLDASASTMPFRMPIPSARATVDLKGYGVAFLKFEPSPRP
jgi:hypothetical protein